MRTFVHLPLMALAAALLVQSVFSAEGPELKLLAADISPPQWRTYGTNFSLLMKTKQNHFATGPNFALNLRYSDWSTIHELIPRLELFQQSDRTLRLTWACTGIGRQVTVEETTTVGPDREWQAVTTTPNQKDGRSVVDLIPNEAGQAVYRLRGNIEEDGCIRVQEDSGLFHGPKYYVIQPYGLSAGRWAITARSSGGPVLLHLRRGRRPSVSHYDFSPSSPDSALEWNLDSFSTDLGSWFLRIAPVSEPVSNVTMQICVLPEE